MSELVQGKKSPIIGLSYLSSTFYFPFYIFKISSYHIYLTKRQGFPFPLTQERKHLILQSRMRQHGVGSSYSLFPLPPPIIFALVMAGSVSIAAWSMEHSSACPCSTSAGSVPLLWRQAGTVLNAPGCNGNGVC